MIGLQENELITRLICQWKLESVFGFCIFLYWNNSYGSNLKVSIPLN